MSNTQTHHSSSLRSNGDELVPRVFVRAVVALLLAVTSLVAIAVLTERPAEHKSGPDDVISERAIFISTEESGNAQFLDTSGSVIAQIPTNKIGSVAGIQRIIDRERLKARADTTAPVLLRLAANNQLSIYDPETNRSAELAGFGTDNFSTFARLLD